MYNKIYLVILILFLNLFLSPVNSSADAPGAISGTVTNGAGTSIANITVNAIDVNGVKTSTSTDTGGNYLVNGLTPGLYTVQFAGTTAWYGNYYNNTATATGATPVAVASGVTTPNINPVLLPAANMSWGGVYHITNPDGSQSDCLDMGINAVAASLGTLTATVTGPGGFSYTFADTDIYPYPGGKLALRKIYASLVTGVYSFTLTDSQGHVSSRVDTHAGSRVLPIIDSTTIQLQRKTDGTYHISWAPVNDTTTYYYRTEIQRAGGSGAIVYVGNFSMNCFDDPPVGTLTDGTAYQLRVGVYDAATFDLTFNQSNSAFVNFTPQSGDYSASKLLVSYNFINNRVDAGVPTVEADIMMSDPSKVTFAELNGPNGFHYQFHLTNDKLASGELWHLFSTPMATGLYTFHVVANSLDHYAYSTLTPAVVYPAPDVSRMQAEDLGNGSIRFSWADVNYTGTLYYRAYIIDTVSGQSIIWGRLNQSTINIPASTLGDLSTKQWRVEVFDSSAATSQRNRINGAYIPLTVQSYDANRPLMTIFDTSTLYLPGGGSATEIIMNGWVTSGILSKRQVDGPGGYSRDTLSKAQYWNGFFSLIEAGSPAEGLYTFTAQESGGKSLTRYNNQTAPHTIPLVDYRTFHVDAEPNGDLRFSWAPVVSDIPVWYSLWFWKSDGSPLTTTTLAQTTSVVVPTSSLQGSLMFAVKTFDGSNPSMVNNASRSVIVGYQGAGFNYGSLVDNDNDGFASNVDSNDYNASVNPFTGITGDITPPATTAWPPAGTYPGSITVSLSANELSTTYYCTGDGCTPTVTYSVPISLAKSQTLRFYSRDTAGNSEAVNTAVYAVNGTLRINFTGSGGGAINSNQNFSCTNSCSQVFPLGGAEINLMPTPDGNSSFPGWSDITCTGKVNCPVNLATDTTVIADFETVSPVKVNASYYNSLYEAYSSVPSGSIRVQARDVPFNESLKLDHSINLTIDGGFDSSFNSYPGVSSLHGKLTISSGSLRATRLVIGTHGGSPAPTNNLPPTATSAVITTSADTQSQMVTPSVSDPNNGDTQTFAIITQPGRGLASVVGNKLVYTPDAGFSGQDSFIYSLTDSAGRSITGTANVTVNLVNHAPTTTGVGRAVFTGTSGNQIPWVNDLDIWDSFTHQILSQPVNGNAAVVGGKLVYSPNGNFTSGTDSFTYRITDSGGASVDGNEIVRVYDNTALGKCKATGSVKADGTFGNTSRANFCAFYGITTTRVTANGTPVTMDYLVNHPSNSNTPKGVVILIGGGNFDMTITGNAATGVADPTGGWNFLVHSAQLFADAGYIAISLDRPSDQPPPGSTDQSGDADHYRVSVNHAIDILQIVRQFNTENLDVFLVGTSRGTISAVAANLIAAGIAISSPLTADPNPNHLYIGRSDTPNLLPNSVKRPVHVMWHLDDMCYLTPPGNAQALFNSLICSTNAAFNSASGGVRVSTATPNGVPVDVCSFQDHHGYLGIEPTAVGYITSWLDARIAALAGNKRPQASFVTVSTAKEAQKRIDLATLVRDQDGDPLTYGVSHSSSSLGGSIAVNGSVVTYIPPAGVSNQTDRFVYIVTDGKGGVGAAVITVNIGS